MKKLFVSLTLLSLFSLVGCGGGGGGGGSGSSSGFYGGTWSVDLARVVNDCSTAAPPNLNLSVVINQEGSRVVLDSGSRMFTGSTNDSDGFIVTALIPGTRGCVTEAGYSFANASDGEATVGLALITRCGKGECLLGYSGVAERQSSPRSVQKHATVDPAAIFGDLMIEKAHSESAPGSTMPGREVETLAELMTP